MKIAFHRKHQSFQDLESSRLKERLAAHEFYDWFAGEKAPAEDIDVLLIVGSLDRATIESQSQLFFIQTASAGYEGIDVDAATEQGIWVSFAPAGETGNAISVAELAIMLMIGASRRINFALASVRDHGLTSNGRRRDALYTPSRRERVLDANKRRRSRRCPRLRGGRGSG